MCIVHLLTPILPPPDTPTVPPLLLLRIVVVLIDYRNRRRTFLLSSLAFRVFPCTLREEPTRKLVDALGVVGEPLEIVLHAPRDGCRRPLGRLAAHRPDSGIVRRRTLGRLHGIDIINRTFGCTNAWDNVLLAAHGPVVGTHGAPRSVVHPRVGC